MNILMINTLYTPNMVGGAEVSVQLLAEELVRKGNRVRVLTLSSSKIREKKEINNVEVVYLPLYNIYWPFAKSRNNLLKLIWHIVDLYNPFMATQVSKEIDDFQPQVVHTNNISGFSVSVWKTISKKKIKLVHTTRDYYLFHPNSTMFSKNAGNMPPDDNSVRFWSFTKRRMSKYVNSYIGISEFIMRFHCDNGFFSQAKSSYIYNAINRIYIKPYASKKLRVGFIGRLTEEKGFSYFCKIADQRKDDASIEFYAAGRFNDNELKLKELAYRSQIILLGFVPIKEFLEKVDIVIFPVKWREPFGRAIAECAMAGKVVITNFVGGITEISHQLSNIYKLEDVNILLDKRVKGVIVDTEGNPFSKENIAQHYLQHYQ